LLSTSSFRDLNKVCKALGLKQKKSKKGLLWIGYSPINKRYVRIAIHQHAEGRDLASGTFQSSLKQLGFSNTEEYKEFLNNS